MLKIQKNHCLLLKINNYCLLVASNRKKNKYLSFHLIAKKTEITSILQ